jgi:hypothetical protein
MKQKTFRNRTWALPDPAEYNKRERERRKFERQDPVKMDAERKRNTIARRAARERQRIEAIEASRTRMKTFREEGRKHFKGMSAKTFLKSFLGILAVKLPF